MPAPALFPHANFDVVVMAASLGGLDALREILQQLPADFAAPVLVVQHTRAPSFLPEVLGARTRLSTTWAETGLRLRPRHVYVAPPDHHLVIGEQFTCELLQTAPVNHTRPAADPLFVSAARRVGPRALGVVLTGYGRDGSLGALAIQESGGTVLVQEPASCAAPSMPQAAIALDAASFVLPTPYIARSLVTLVMVPFSPTLFLPRRAA